MRHVLIKKIPLGLGTPVNELIVSIFDDVQTIFGEVLRDRPVLLLFEGYAELFLGGRDRPKYRPILVKQTLNSVFH